MSEKHTGVRVGSPLGALRNGVSNEDVSNATVFQTCVNMIRDRHYANVPRVSIIHAHQWRRQARWQVTVFSPDNRNSWRHERRKEHLLAFVLHVYEVEIDSRKVPDLARGDAYQTRNLRPNSLVARQLCKVSARA